MFRYLIVITNIFKTGPHPNSMQNIRIPFTFIPLKQLFKFSNILKGVSEKLKLFFPFLKLTLEQVEYNIEPRDYIALCLTSSLFFFIFFSLFLFLILNSFELKNTLLIAPFISLIISLFVFIQQILYPKFYLNSRIKKIEQNLLPSLRATLIQLNSGIPLFNILVSISNENYGAVSDEFKRAVKKINAGYPEIDALEEIAKNNPSLFFRRAIWQLVNGMKAGSDIKNTLENVIDSLSKEQSIQIENYGSKLNPLAMFYMLVVIIIPSLATTLLVVMTSFLPLGKTGLNLLFFGLYALVLFFQIIFLGMIRTRRPNLIGN